MQESLKIVHHTNLEELLMMLNAESSRARGYTATKRHVKAFKSFENVFHIRILIVACQYPWCER